jgi:hypothetical protein
VRLFSRFLVIFLSDCQRTAGIVIPAVEFLPPQGSQTGIFF